MASSTVHQAVVKYVISGDTLVVKLKNHSNNAEQRISLNHINAPKLARPPTDNDGKGASPDEPYAFECREYLRKKLVGHEIFYTVDFQIPQSNRLICSVYLGADPSTSENLIESLLREGLVELRTQKGVRANDPGYRRLLRISQEAKTNQVGRYSTDRPEQHIREMKWTLNDPKEFVERHKTLAPIDAVVEFIRDGNTLRCLLLPHNHLMTIQLTGIRCPIIKREGNSELIEQDEPFAQEAKDFVEARLLQREVKIVFGGMNNQNILGTLLHPNGNIGLFLLKEGLATCADRTMPFLPPAWREQYRAAEKFARDRRLKLWRNYIPRTTTNQNDEALVAKGKNYQAQVLEIVNADALIIRDLRDNQIQKIYLSSVRTPRATDLISTEDRATSAQISVKRTLYDIPYLWEGHEFLRKRLIGKTVRIDTDYVKTATDEYPEKICCTVYLGNVNMGEALISRGLAKPQSHRQSYEQRSPHYDALISAEQHAMKRCIGLFSNGTGLRRIIDMTGEGNKKRAQDLLDVLKRNGRMDGIVDFVTSGSRFRIHLLRDNYLISFLLSSIQCPRPERRVTGANTEKLEPAEPFGTEALNFAKEHFLQRDVIVEVENVDRAGNFIGRLTIADGQSAALMLVQAALAKLQNSSARHSVDYKLLVDAEEHCKRQRSGIWTNYEEPNTVEQEQELNEQTDENNAEPDILNFNSPNFHRVMVTYVSSDFKIYVQYSNQGHRVEQLQSDLRRVFTEKEPIVGFNPKKGQLAAAKFSADDEWYRVRIEKVESNNRLSVYYIDYGNRELITDTNRLAALPSDFSKLPGQAHEYELAYVRAPPDSDDRDEARNSLLQTIGNNECLIRVEYRRNNVEYISLYHAMTKENFVKTLAEQGLIIIAQGRLQTQRKPLVKELEQAQSIAKTSRMGLWQYSDQIEDDATEFGFTNRK